MTDSTDKKANPQDSKRIETKTLDTVFPSKWLLGGMVGFVLIFNIIVGMKVFSLQKEKAVIEILKARYESYEKIISDVEDKEARLRQLTQEIIPLEKRSENAQKDIARSNESLEKNKESLNKVKATESEVVEKLNAARKTIAELNDGKQTLRQEKTNLENLVAEIEVKERRIEQKITERQKDLRVIEENIIAAELQLKNQKEQIINVAAANSDFDAIRKQLSDFLSKMDEAQGQATKRLSDIEKVVTDISKERDLLSKQTSSLNNETKTISQSNQSINKELLDLKGHNEGYKAQVDAIASLSGQMGRNSELITAAATELGNHDKKIQENLKIFEDTTGQIKTTYQGFAQTGSEFKSAVVEIGTQISEVTSRVESQKNQFDAYLKELSSVTDLKVQANTFKKIIGEIEDSSRSLSEKFSNIQNNFEGKLNGMNLSFDSLEKEFVALGRKVEALQESLQKIKSKVEEEVDKRE